MGETIHPAGGGEGHASGDEPEAGWIQTLTRPLLALTVHTWTRTPSLSHVENMTFLVLTIRGGCENYMS